VLVLAGRALLELPGPLPPAAAEAPREVLEQAELAVIEAEAPPALQRLRDRVVVVVLLLLLLARARRRRRPLTSQRVNQRLLGIVFVVGLRGLRVRADSLARGLAAVVGEMT
jgi:hypothetical protein